MSDTTERSCTQSSLACRSACSCSRQLYRSAIDIPASCISSAALRFSSAVKSILSCRENNRNSFAKLLGAVHWGRNASCCVATWCAALQRVVLRYNVVCWVVTRCAGLQRGALRCNVPA
jgi:hypothetical protein